MWRMCINGNAAYDRDSRESYRTLVAEKLHKKVTRMYELYRR